MTLSPIHSSGEIIERAIQIAGQGRKKTVAVAAAQDADVLDAVSTARSEGFLEAILIGDKNAIEKASSDNGIDLEGMEIVDEPDVNNAAHSAASLVSQKKADAIMKGFLPTSALLKVVLNKQYSLRGKNTLSHCAVLDIPGYHKLLNFTDGGMVVKPDKEQKLSILENAILVEKALGLSPVRIAVSGASDSVDERLPHTVTDVDYVIPRAREMFDDVEVEGPMPLDMATSRSLAEYRGRSDNVSGQADIYLVDTIEECNLVSKTLIQFAGAVFAGVIVGARVPVSLVSRTDTVQNKKASLALACLVADYYSQYDIWGEGR